MINTSTTQSEITGIITRRDNDHIYVWKLNSDMREYKFPRFASEYSEFFKIGTAVRFVPGGDFGDIEDPTKIRKDSNSNLTIITNEYNSTEFCVRTTISFPPDGFDYYAAQLADVKNFGCSAVGFSPLFNRVVLFGKINFEPGKVYIGFVTRIDSNREWLGKKLNTLFMVSASQKLKEVTDPWELDSNRQFLPWKDFLRSPGQLEKSVYFDAENYAGSNSALAGSSGLQSLLATPKQKGHLLDTPVPVVNDQPVSGINIGTMNLQQGNGKWIEMKELKEEVCRHVANKEQQQEGVHVSGSTLSEATTAGLPSNLELVKSQENAVFGSLVAHKLEWVNAQSATAAIQLQKKIMDLCYLTEVEVFGYNTGP